MKINKINVAQPIKQRNANASTPSFAGVTPKKVLLTGHAGLGVEFLKTQIDKLPSHVNSMKKRFAATAESIVNRARQAAGQ